MPDGAFPNLSEPEAEAAQALIEDAGCLEERAEQLVTAVATVAAQEALAIIAGTATVSGSIVDTRVARLKQIIEALPKNAPFPDPYEVSVMFRITPSQARTLINTYQARYTADYRDRIKELVQAAEAEATQKDKRNVWVIDFSDPAALDYSFETLKRRGLSKTLERDRTAMTITVDRDQKDRHGKNAVEVLECTVKK